jgi:hypothetical protein
MKERKIGHHTLLSYGKRNKEGIITATLIAVFIVSLVLYFHSDRTISGLRGDVSP